MYLFNEMVALAAAPPGRPKEKLRNQALFFATKYDDRHTITFDTTRFKTNKPRNTQHTTNMNTIDSAQQETPTQSEENNHVIRHRYNVLARGGTDALFANLHKGDPQERDRRVLRTILFITSTGLAMIVAATFATVLELPDSWQNLWLAICIGFTLLFFVGVLRLTSELS
jgi:hypothetical protein